MIRLNKTAAALACGLLLTLGGKAQTEQFDLSTAVGGPSTAPILIAPGGNDDTWSVQLPGTGGTVIPRVCSTFPSWANDFTCGSRWVSPYLDASFSPDNGPTGDYRFFTTFNLSKCTESALLDIRKIGGDNHIRGIQVNGFLEPFNSFQTNDFSPLIGPMTITINPAHLTVGTNTLSFIINNDGNSYVGFNFCGSLNVVYTDNVVPSIAGNSVFCGTGSTFTFTGSDGPGTATEYQWQLLPASGSVPLYSSSVTAGSPGSFTFPNTLFTCNNTYRVRLRVNTCSGWLQTDKTINYSCPVASAGADQTICQGVCVNIGAGTPVALTTYKWTVGGTVVGTAAQINVCPATTTTYRLEANRAGCIVSDDVTITVSPNNPDFNITYVSAGTTAYYGAKATPVATVPSGGGFGWFLEEVGESFTISNPDRWWSDPVNVFQGFDRTGPYSGSVTWLPTTPATGKFLFNKTYRLSRGTWTATCPWNGVTKEFGLHPRGPGEEPMLWVRDVAPLDFDNLTQTATASVTEADLAGGLRIFPNPSTGVFTVLLDNSAAGLVEVFDVLGKKVETVKLSAGTDTYRVDLSGYAKGIYVVNVTAGDVKQSRKILLQ